MVNKISVFGLGKLGCTMLACFARKGWHVIGMDISKDFVDKINRFESPIFEPEVDSMLKKYKSFIAATMDASKAISESEVSFVIVPTPSNKSGTFSTKYVEEVMLSIGKALKEKIDYHLIVLTSTVMPGDTEKMMKILENTSGKICGEDFGLCYNPDFIALGRIVYDFLNPDIILIGEFDKKSGDSLEEIHSKLTDNNHKTHRMTFYNAELTKISINCFLTMKINYANVIGEICERMPSGDAEKVLNAVGDDSRIGRRYMIAGMPLGGPCLPRDNRAFKQAAKFLGVSHSYADLSNSINKYHKEKRIPKIILDILHAKNSNEISILGVTYKEDVSVIDETPVLEIVKYLTHANILVRIYDPAGMPDFIKKLGSDKNVVFSDSIEACLKGSSLCFIATPWKQFKDLTIDFYKNIMAEKFTIFDGWGIYKGTIIENEADYRRIGVN